MASTALLTASEAALRLGVSARTIARWADSGRLTVAQKLPGETGALLFDQADVEALSAAVPEPTETTS